MTVNNVFVLGNGESRLEHSLEELRDYGRIYGCNAIYRDFSPDVLVAIDRHMVDEIVESSYPDNHVCYFARDHRANEIPPKCLVGEYGKTQYCGPTAIRLSILLDKPQRIYMLGFDIFDKKWSNVYSGTEGYEDNRIQAQQMVAQGQIIVHNKLTLTQLRDIFTSFSNIEFYKVMGPDQFQYTQWQGIKNISYLTPEQLYKQIHNE